MSYLKQRYPMVWDEVYHSVRADCVQAIAPSKWDESQLERIAHNAACFAVCVHHKQWCVSATNYPNQLKSYKPAICPCCTGDGIGADESGWVSCRSCGGTGKQQ